MSPDTDSPEPETFADLDLQPQILQVLDSLGYEEPTPIQVAAIPLALAGSDILGQAATGTGKTAAFALPLIQNLIRRREAGAKPERPTALILVPTRELAMQVSEAIHTYGKSVGARVLPVYGGQPISRQLKELRRGVDIVVATPGRAMDHLARRSLDLALLETVILDEADEMLDMGFAEDIEQILSGVPDSVQTMLFSATMPNRIATLAGKHLNNPTRITIEHDSPASGDNPQIREIVYVVNKHHKPQALARVLDIEAPDAALVFCRTRNDVDELTHTMNGRGYRAEALHGGMTQDQRDRVMNHVRTGATELLIATDVAARGLDIDTLTHVVNHTVPGAPESYVHRIGRVGRAGREGVAITLVAPREHRALRTIERHTGRKMQVEQVPTVADLRAKRLGLIRAQMREAMLIGDELDSFRPVVESLGDEFDTVEMALAAIKLLHDETAGEAEEREVPTATLDGGGGGGGKQGRPKGERGGGGKGKKRNSRLYDKSDSAAGNSGGAHRGNAYGGSGHGGSGHGESASIWVSLGRDSGVRPKDLVGAIAGETSLSGGDVGSIQINARFSLVEVPSRAVDEVLTALNRTRLRGNRGKARLDRAG